MYSSLQPVRKNEMEWHNNGLLVHQYWIYSGSFNTDFKMVHHSVLGVLIIQKVLTPY